MSERASGRVSYGLLPNYSIRLESQNLCKLPELYHDKAAQYIAKFCKVVEVTILKVMRELLVHSKVI